MSITDAVSRVSQIQAQLLALQQGPSSLSGSAGSAPSASPAAPAAGGAPAPSFATQLAQATGTGLATPGAGSSLPVSGGAGLPPGASRLLTSDQQTFASRLAAQTGLDSGVISAWLLAEESSGAAQARQSAHNNDWLNIGYTDSGTYGSADSIWSDPVRAADATAGWLRGQNTIPGYGTASAGVRGILSTAGQPPQAQIAALQGSGWASSGYPDLPGLYSQLTA